MSRFLDEAEHLSHNQNTSVASLRLLFGFTPESCSPCLRIAVRIGRNRQVATTKRVRLALVGHDGNAFAILGRFRRAARQQGWSTEQIKAVTDEAMNGDYNHLLATIMQHTTGN